MMIQLFFMESEVMYGEKGEVPEEEYLTPIGKCDIKREGKDDYWLNLGVAFPHEDGEGFNLLLQALPIDGKIVLRTYKEEEEEKPKGKPSYKK